MALSKSTLKVSLRLKFFLDINYFKPLWNFIIRGQNFLIMKRLYSEQNFFFFFHLFCILLVKGLIFWQFTLRYSLRLNFFQTSITLFKLHRVKWIVDRFFL